MFKSKKNPFIKNHLPAIKLKTKQAKQKMRIIDRPGVQGDNLRAGQSVDEIANGDEIARGRGL